MSKRKAISLKTKLASALACLLPQAERDELRRRHATADEVISRFHQDHIAPHADGGSDEWHNLDPRPVAAHQEKTAKIDIPRIAKGKRIRRKRAESFDRMIAKYGAKLAVTTSPELDEMLADTRKRPRRNFRLPSRPFPNRPYRTGRFTGRKFRYT